MAVQRKLGYGLVKLHNSVTSADGTTLTTTETWTGPYQQLGILQNSVFQKVKATSLTPSSGGDGVLTITREQITDKPEVPKVTTIEVIWQELRLPVEQHPYFSDMTGSQIAIVKEAAANGVYSGFGGIDGLAGVEAYKLAELYEQGHTEYNTGVPVVRRTITGNAGDLTAGNAWFRDTPPLVPAGDWEWLKSADNRRREGNSYTQIEEWIGGKNLSPILYP